MPLMILAIVVFVTVVLVVFAFGAAVVTPSSVLGARLRALGGQITQAPEKPAIKRTSRAGARSHQPGDSHVAF
jgi:hypothetical protein